MEAGNFAAVGSMSPGVEIWDLDVTDSVEPVASLGGELPGTKDPKPGKKPKKGSSRKVHTLLILLLSAAQKPLLPWLLPVRLLYVLSQ